MIVKYLKTPGRLSYYLFFIILVLLGGTAPLLAATVKLEADLTVTNVHKLLAGSYARGQTGTLVLVYNTHAVDGDAGPLVGLYKPAHMKLTVTVNGEIVANANHGTIVLRDSGAENDGMKFVTHSGLNFKQAVDETLTGPQKSGLPLIIASFSLKGSRQDAFTDGLLPNIPAASRFSSSQFGLQYCSSCGTGGGFGRGVGFDVSNVKWSRLDIKDGAFTYSEDFDGTALPEFLVQSKGGVSARVSGGRLTFPGLARPQGRRDLGKSRSYVRTLAMDLAADSFVADITTTLVPGTAYGTAFFGIGPAEPTADFWGEPREGSHIYMRAAPSVFANGYLGVTRNRVENPVASVIQGAGDGTHRLRIAWNADRQQATFAVHKNYTGGEFQATSILGPIGTKELGFTYRNASVFFGGASGVQFDDFSITLAVGVSFNEISTLLGSALNVPTAQAAPDQSRVMHTQSAQIVGGFGARPIPGSSSCNDHWYNPFAGSSMCSLSSAHCDPGLHIVGDICLPSKTWKRKSAGNWAIRWDGSHELKAIPPAENNFIYEIKDGGTLPDDGLYIFVFRTDNGKLLIRRSDRPDDKRCYDPNGIDVNKKRDFSYPMNPASLPGDNPPENPMFVRHTQLSNWADVWSGGQLEIHNGSIIWISNESGHYRPGPLSLNYVVSLLETWSIADQDSIHRFIVIDLGNGRLHNPSHKTSTDCENEGAGIPGRNPPLTQAEIVRRTTAARQANN